MADMYSLTKLSVKASLDDMEIGDCIPCKYTATTSGKTGAFSNFGRVLNGTESFIPYNSSATPDGYFYFIKVDNGTLIADRNIQHSVSYNETIRQTYGYSYNYLYENEKQTSNTSPFTITSSGVHGNDTRYDSYKAFNKLSSTDFDRWLSASDTNQWICYNYKKVTLIDSVKFYNPLGYNRPKNCIVYISHNGVNFIELKKELIPNVSSATIKIDAFAMAIKFHFVDCYRNINTYGIAVEEITIKHRTYSPNQYTYTIPSGGVAFSDSNSNPTNINDNFGGWSLENDWEKYIVNSTLNGKITPGDNDIWHINSDCGSMCLSISSSKILETNYVRTICRGKENTNNVGFCDITYSGSDVGYRPIMKYIDNTIIDGTKPLTKYY